MSLVNALQPQGLPCFCRRHNTADFPRLPKVHSLAHAHTCARPTSGRLARKAGSPQATGSREELVIKDMLVLYGVSPSRARLGRPDGQT